MKRRSRRWDCTKPTRKKADRNKPTRNFEAAWLRRLVLLEEANRSLFPQEIFTEARKIGFQPISAGWQPASRARQDARTSRWAFSSRTRTTTIPLNSLKADPRHRARLPALQIHRIT
jgi:hypothetical protein